MPEEINRRVASLCASVNFCPTVLAAQNLAVEGIDPTRIVVTGNTIVDAVLRFRNPARTAKLVEMLDVVVAGDPFAILTLHRPATVDDPVVLDRVIRTLMHLPIKIIFPVHPRTRGRLSLSELDKKLKTSNI
jgi:UDP-N-acetylglucosamine 2-epimerase (non-hydrolysing)